MWNRLALKEDQLMSKVRFSLPVLSTDKNLLSSQSQLHNKELNLGEEMVCTLGDDMSQIPSVIRSTMRLLSSRHSEVSQWQTLISESVKQVDWEITAVEQVKVTAECCVQEKQLYSQLMSDCLAISYSLSPALQRRDRIVNELKKEEQLTNESRDELQKQICVLLNKKSSLNEIRVQLLADLRDKKEAIKLTAKCITHDLNTPSFHLPDIHYKPNHVSYDKWLSNCKNLKLKAENLIKGSSSARRNLRLMLANLKNAQERQHRSTVDALRMKINELSGVHRTLMGEKQEISDEISDLTNDIEKVMGQIRNCDSKLHRAIHRLDILNQRPGHELCLDQSYFSLMLEKHDLANMSAVLHQILKRSQHNLELERRRLIILEDKLAKNARVLEVEQKCQNLHRCSLPVVNTSVILANKPKLLLDRPSAHYSQ